MQVLQSGASSQQFPSQTATMWIRLSGSNEALILSGIALPNQTTAAATITGGVTVAPASLAFLRGAGITANPGLLGIGQGFVTFSY
jgi:hypothetical protein